MSHNFPGNIRELENLLEHAFVMCRGSEIKPEHLPREFREIVVETEHHQNALTLRSRSVASEAEIIIEVLKRSRGHHGNAAKELGINTSTLWRKMKKLNIVNK